MFYNNYKILYYPDDEGGGGGGPTVESGGEEGGGEEGGGSAEEGSGGAGAGYGDEGVSVSPSTITTLDKERTPRQKRKQRTKSKEELELDKQEVTWLEEQRIKDLTTIKSLEVQSSSRLIAAKGEKRRIRIAGATGAVFTLTIKDSSGCSIVDEELENIEIPKNGIYEFTQHFPAIANGMVEEYYEVTMFPAANTYLGNSIANSTPTYTLYQYPDPTLTFTTTSTASSPALSVAVSGTASTVGRANHESFSTISWVLTITEDSATNGNFYIKNNTFLDAISTDSIIKKVVQREVGEDPKSRTLQLKHLTTRAIGSTTSGVTTKGNKNHLISGDLSAGMIVKGKVEKSKIVTNSLEVPTCRKKTNKFELNDTVDLFEDMWMYIDGIRETRVVSIDCNRNITVSDKIIIRQNTDVEFKYNIGATIRTVEAQVNSIGQACVVLDRSVHIPDNTELEFDDTDTRISGVTRFTGAGTDSIVLTNEIDIIRFGTRDVTYTLDLDKLITRKPTARSLDVEVIKDTAKTIVLSNSDFDSNATSKVPVVTQSGNNASSTVAKDASDSGYTTPAIVYTPIPGFVGDDIIKYQLKDDDEANDLSDEKTIKITVVGTKA